MKKQNGITLIALVIIIIVLLILAGVSISAIVGENGIVTKAKDAKTQSIIGREKESLALAYSTSQTDNLLLEDVTKEQLREELEKLGENVEVTEENTSLIVKYTDTGNEYEITQEGNIEEFENVGIYVKLYSYDDGTG